VAWLGLWREQHEERRAPECSQMRRDGEAIASGHALVPHSGEPSMEGLAARLYAPCDEATERMRWRSGWAPARPAREVAAALVADNCCSTTAPAVGAGGGRLAAAAEHGANPRGSIDWERVPVG
jgi:hypothetical protein